MVWRVLICSLSLSEAANRDSCQQWVPGIPHGPPAASRAPPQSPRTCCCHSPELQLLPCFVGAVEQDRLGTPGLATLLLKRDVAVRSRLFGGTELIAMP